MTLLTTLLAAVALLSACGTTPGPVDPEPDPGPVASPGQPIQLSSGQDSASFELENTSGDTLDWTIEVNNSGNNPQSGQWFTISPAQGRLGPFERQIVTLTQRSGLEPGRYSSVLRVVFQGGSTSFDVIGEVLQDGSEDGDGRISGFLRTDNALIPLDPPTSFARSSALDSGELQVQQERPLAVAGQLIVGLEPGARQLSADGDDPVSALAARHEVEVVSEDGTNATALIETGGDTASLAARLEADPAVSYVEPNYLFYPHSLPNDPLLQDAWQLPVVGAPVAWQAPASAGSGPIVAVIDSGIDIDHEDLSGVFVSGGYDFCANSGCTRNDSDPRPDSLGDTHGTHVTGLLAAITGNGRGTGGVAGELARVVPIKVFSGGSTTAEALAEAIRWAAGLSVSGAPTNSFPADIITLSLGAEMDSRLVREAVEAATNSGSLLVASAGNQGHGTVDYPARYPGVLGVGAVNSEFERSCFSDYGSGLDLMAPGGDGFLPIEGCQGAADEAILSTFPGSDYGIDAGTSMAAPLAAGAAALVWSQLSSPDPAEVRNRLIESAYFDDGFMSEDRYGAGIVRADLALGFPGPGDDAAVQATGPSSALDTVTLLPDGTSTDFSLNGLAAGSYTVAADAAGERFTLVGSASFQLFESEDIEGARIGLER